MSVWPCHHRGKKGLPSHCPNPFSPMRRGQVWPILELVSVYLSLCLSVFGDLYMPPFSRVEMTKNKGGTTLHVCASLFDAYSLGNAYCLFLLLSFFDFVWPACVNLALYITFSCTQTLQVMAVILVCLGGVEVSPASCLPDPSVKQESGKTMQAQWLRLVLLVHGGHQL